MEVNNKKGETWSFEMTHTEGLWAHSYEINDQKFIEIPLCFFFLKKTYSEL